MDALPPNHYEPLAWEPAVYRLGVLAGPESLLHALLLASDGGYYGQSITAKRASVQRLRQRLVAALELGDFFEHLRLPERKEGPAITPLQCRPLPVALQQYRRKKYALPPAVAATLTEELTTLLDRWRESYLALADTEGDANTGEPGRATMREEGGGGCDSDRGDPSSPTALMTTDATRLLDSFLAFREYLQYAGRADSHAADNPAPDPATLAIVLTHAGRVLGLNIYLTEPGFAHSRYVVPMTNPDGETIILLRVGEESDGPTHWEPLGHATTTGMQLTFPSDSALLRRLRERDKLHRLHGKRSSGVTERGQ